MHRRNELESEYLDGAKRIGYTLGREIVDAYHAFYSQTGEVF